MTEPESSLPNHESQEEWRVIADFSDYEVSSLGRVRRRVAHPQRPSHYPAGYILSPGRTLGYLQIGLPKDGRIHHLRIHRLVAFAFLPPPLSGQIQINHKDGVKHNNVLSNLEWATPLQNQRHAIEVLGHDKSGERHFAAKLSTADVRKIHALRMQGVSSEDIAPQFGVTASCIVRILARKGRQKELSDLEPSYPSIKGHKIRGTGNPMAKLTDEVVREIRRLLAQGISGREIARQTGAHPQTVSNIKTGKSWVHIQN